MNRRDWLRAPTPAEIEANHKTADRCLLAIAVILGFALFSGWL
jgi:hypothetical protein